MATDSTRQPTRPDPPARADRNAEHGTRTRTRSADADAQRPVRTPLTRPPTHHPLPRTPCRLCQTACANGYGSYGLDSRWYFLIFCQDERRRAVATFSTITDPRHLGAGRPRAAGKPLKKAGPVHVPRPLPGVLCFLYTCCFSQAVPHYYVFCTLVVFSQAVPHVSGKRWPCGFARARQGLTHSTRITRRQAPA